MTKYCIRINQGFTHLSRCFEANESRRDQSQLTPGDDVTLLML